MTTSIESDMKTRVSRYMSYLLRHDSENLKMDEHGFVHIDELLEKLREKFKISKDVIFEIVDKSHRRRFEIVGDKIRALYGHTMPVKLELEEDTTVEVLYHGTTSEAASRILKVGLKPMRRRWVHLSPTIEIAKEVGLRRSKAPVVLEVNAEAARRDGVRFYKAADKVYLCSSVSPKHIKPVLDRSNRFV